MQKHISTCCPMTIRPCDYWWLHGGCSAFLRLCLSTSFKAKSLPAHFDVPSELKKCLGICSLFSWPKAENNIFTITTIDIWVGIWLKDQCKKVWTLIWVVTGWCITGWYRKWKYHSALRRQAERLRMTSTRGKFHSHGRRGASGSSCGMICRAP